jgi:UrcA family protein
MFRRCVAKFVSEADDHKGSEVEGKIPEHEPETNMNSYAKTDSRILALVGSVVVAVSAFLLAHGASAAINDNEVAMAVVKFQDLDVNTPTGTAALYWRIHAAANRVCGVDEHSVLPSRGGQLCAQEAEARAIGQLNFARLTAFYQAKTGKLPAARISMAK